MRWFKHYANSQTSSSLDNLINEFGFEGYGRYWRLLEFLSSNFDGESVSFRFHNRTLRDCLRFKSRLKLSCYLVAIGLQTGFKVVENEDYFEIEAPILLNLKSRDFKKARAKSATESPRIDKDKDKDKDKYNGGNKTKKAADKFYPVCDELKQFEHIFKNVTQVTQKKFIERYHIEYIMHIADKIEIYIESKPRYSVNGSSISNWLSRNYDEWLKKNNRLPPEIENKLIIPPMTDEEWPWPELLD